MEVINYLLGYKNLKVYQDTDCFNFSLDSVLLANFATLNKSVKKILDIGTGNAVIPIILSTKTSSNIDAVEVQEKSFILGKKSIELNNLKEKINIINEDINDYYLRCETEIYDLIVCNPPFFRINENSKINDSEYKQIARHEIKLNLDQLFKVSKKLLKNGGLVSVVHRPERLIEIIESMKKHNIEPKKIQFVYPKVGTESNIVLIEGKKNGNSGLKILHPLITHNNDGSYTKEIEKYFS